MPYAGRAAFEWHCQSMIAKLPAKDRKNYIVAPNRRRAWEVAVSSAEHAWMLSREQRVDEFIPPMSSAAQSPGLTADSRFSSAGGCTSEPASHGSSDKPDGRGDTSAMVYLRSSSTDLVVPLRSAVHDQFGAFCRHNRKSLCLMHPGFTAEQIDRLLQMQWSQLDSAEKSKYAGHILCYC